MAGGHEDHVAAGSDSRPASAFDGLAAGLSGLGNHSPAVPLGRHDNPERLLPGLHDEERLPWLDADEGFAEDAGADARRMWAVVLSALALLLVIGGVWWTVHRRNEAALTADGSLIPAPPGPIKEAPQDPGGKTFDGTGDSSFTVSQGHVPGATLANGGDGMNDVAPDAATAQMAHPAAAGGIGVQVGAFATQDAAESGWAHLAKSYDALSGLSHRVVAGSADIGTVWHLQAVAGSDDAANALCDRLKAAGLNCEVKD